MKNTVSIIKLGTLFKFLEAKKIYKTLKIFFKQKQKLINENSINF
jgi:hypothetical protein